jgi:hypothetical protein
MGIDNCEEVRRNNGYYIHQGLHYGVWRPAEMVTLLNKAVEIGRH